MSVLTDSHDSMCGCTSPIAHMLSVIFPKGHKDLNKTVQEIIDRELKAQQCLFTGKEERDGGDGEGETIEEKIIRDQEEEGLLEDNIEDLIAAAEDAERR